MLETHLNSPVARRRLRTGPAADHIDAFADWLHLHGYRPTSINNLLRSLAAWTDWMLAAGFTAQEFQTISPLVGDAGVSIEVFSDFKTSAEQMFAQGQDMFTWIPNAYIKYPCTHEGLRAAQPSVEQGMRVNITLCFSQEQAAAVYAATKGTKEPAYVSPFVGRLDDRGENGMDLRGWARSASGDTAEGIPWIEQGIRDFQATGVVPPLAYYLSLNDQKTERLSAIFGSAATGNPIMLREFGTTRIACRLKKSRPRPQSRF
jgi:Transaldolase/Fructose-6-phosphate aldolase